MAFKTKIKKWGVDFYSQGYLDAKVIIAKEDGQKEQLAKVRAEIDGEIAEYEELLDDLIPVHGNDWNKVNACIKALKDLSMNLFTEKRSRKRKQEVKK